MVLFTAEITSTKILHTILKCLTYQEFAVVRTLHEGLKISIEDLKCCETAVYIPAQIFDSYYISTDETKFKISLKIFVECLHMFRKDRNSTMKLTYKENGCPLVLIIKHSVENITVDCHLNTFSIDDYQEVSLVHECKENSIIFNGHHFNGILSNIDKQSYEFEIEMDADKQRFYMSVVSPTCQTNIKLPRNSNVILHFRCKSDFKAKYVFTNLKLILRIFRHASEVILSTGDTGLLALQFIINSDDRQIFVEHFMSSLYG